MKPTRNDLGDRGRLAEVSMIESLISIAFCLSSLVTVIILLLPSQYAPLPKSKISKGKQEPAVQILVLGDIGRSPRMQYHALSIAQKGGKVVVIGYRGNHSKISHYLT